MSEIDPDPWPAGPSWGFILAALLVMGGYVFVVWLVNWLSLQ